MDQKFENPRKFFYGYIVVAISLLIMALMWAGHYSFGVFFKPVLNDFGWTRATTSGAFSIASLLNAFLTIVMGWLTDRFGPRVVMTISGLFLGLGFILMSQIDSILHLYIFYGLLVGMGMSGAFIPLTSTVARWFVKRRGLMTGIVTAGSGIGGLISPPIASRLILNYGWRLSFAILGSVVLGGVVLLAQFIKKEPSSIGQLPFGETQIDQPKENVLPKGLSLSEAIHHTKFWIFFPTGFCYGYCVFTIMVHIVPHAIDLKIEPVKAANILATVGGLSIIGKIFMGKMGDLIGSRSILIFGFFFVSVALISIFLTNNFFILLISGALFGFGYGGIAVSHSPIIAEMFGLKAHGLIFGILNLSVMSGGAIGPLLTGYIFDLTKSYKQAFLLCEVIGLSGFILAIILKIIKDR